MADRNCPSDERILQAVQSTRAQWAVLLEASEVNDLERWLAQAAGGDPETVRQATNRVLDLLHKYPQAQARVTGALGIKGALEAFRMYEPQAGQHDPPESVLMVCPVDPTHYCKRLRQKGQMLFCPQHGVPLVPADSMLTEPEA